MDVSIGDAFSGTIRFDEMAFDGFQVGAPVDVQFITDSAEFDVNVGGGAFQDSVSVGRTNVTNGNADSFEVSAFPDTTPLVGGLDGEIRLTYLDADAANRGASFSTGDSLTDVLATVGASAAANEGLLQLEIFNFDEGPGFVSLGGAVTSFGPASASAAAVPEPSSFALLSVVGVGAVYRRWRNRRAESPA